MSVVRFVYIFYQQEEERNTEIESGVEELYGFTQFYPNVVTTSADLNTCAEGLG